MVAITEDVLSHEHLHDVIAHVQHDAAGAVVTFHGTVRNHSLGHNIEYLEYEAYQPMAERELERIVQRAEQEFNACCAAIHRVGKLHVGETSVVLAASSAHRAQAFQACSFMMDTIKKTVPIWKKEVATNGYWWVEDPTSATPTSATQDAPVAKDSDVAVG